MSAGQFTASFHQLLKISEAPAYSSFEQGPIRIPKESRARINVTRVVAPCGIVLLAVPAYGTGFQYGILEAVPDAD